ncbi:DUF58 domain-containing protein [Alicyclobacillus cycloheptanicus]|uniref:Uncharacterized protein (DUF58 family) n=1 Tax=Alicyclobacillus cycloheptanicus TaxID=1457 RepID=A0ABT9XLI5_9BACL|nr:DUF58 domain-containing protein [Alicyclobacillus cycloheptanicus]MDQ0191170.1 uncharacterized protein (DUF58 family) [Alicyclobacillus cycloheptanicus]WDM02018.1 DUF58 domain-containing protein [Alicyclobacillus cycloheptanicus]
MRVLKVLGLSGVGLIWGALFVFARVQGAFFAWFLFYFWTLLVVYEGLVWSFGLRGVETSRSLSASRLSAGQPLEITLSLTRRGWWPLLWVRVRDDLPERWRFQTLGAERVLQPMWSTEASFVYQVDAVQRGVYALGDTTVETGDVFGLVHRTACIRRFDEVMVYPQIVPVRGWAGYHPEEQGLRQPTRRRAEESTNVLGVRSYVPGDRLSRIHWPASARRGELQAKEFELHVTSELLFLIDAAETSFASRPASLFELEMTVAASLLKHAFDLRRQFAFTMHARGVVSLPAGRDQALLFRCMEELALARPDGQTGFQETLLHMVNEVVPGTTLVVLSPEVNRETAAAVHAVRHRSPVEWFMPVPGGQLTDGQREGVEMLERAGARVYLIPSPESLNALQRGGMHRAAGG